MKYNNKNSELTELEQYNKAYFKSLVTRYQKDISRMNKSYYLPEELKEINIHKYQTIC